MHLFYHTQAAEPVGLSTVFGSFSFLHRGVWSYTGADKVAVITKGACAQSRGRPPGLHTNHLGTFTLLMSKSHLKPLKSEILED